MEISDVQMSRGSSSGMESSALPSYTKLGAHVADMDNPPPPEHHDVAWGPGPSFHQLLTHLQVYAAIPTMGRVQVFVRFFWVALIYWPW